MVFVKMEFTDI